MTAAFASRGNWVEREYSLRTPYRSGTAALAPLRVLGALACGGLRGMVMMLGWGAAQGLTLLLLEARSRVDDRRQAWRADAGVREQAASGIAAIEVILGGLDSSR